MKTVLTHLSLIALILTACAPPEQTPPTATQPAQATATSAPPLATSTPLPNPTEAPSTTILTTAQKKRLHEVAISFSASTQEEATKVAERLDYVQYPSPSNVCGPLAIAMLRDAGLINPLTDPHDFWLLKPVSKRALLAQTFPAGQFENFRFSTPINQFDFNAFPLQPGDFVYLYAGIGDKFEHILTVTRVDEFGRAFSVTSLNLSSEGYYIIQEALLYDPLQPGVGIFYSWTNPQNPIGTTGRGGIEIWRFASAVEENN